jgi:hypothetical protein
MELSPLQVIVIPLQAIAMEIANIRLIDMNVQ